MNSNMKKRIIILSALILLSAAIYYGWNFFNAYVNKGKITASGTVEVIEVQVGSKVSGRVLELYVDEGSNIKKNDNIVKIDVPELEQQYESAKALEEAAKTRSENADEDLNRISNLYEEGMASAQQYDNTRTLADTADKTYIQSQANASLAKIQLDDGLITAPIDGTILVKAVEVGELVSPGSTVVTMADLKTLELKVYVTEREVGKIGLGDKVNISVDSYPGQKFIGNVKFISEQAEFTPKNIQTKEERVNQVFEVKVNISNSDLKLKPGMPADAEIEINVQK